MTITDSQGGHRGARSALGSIVARLNGWRADGSDGAIARRNAGAAFLIRVASAAIIYVSQVLLARWMGRFEFGIYVYVWAWVGSLGALAPLGLAYSAQRFVPEYRARNDRDGLRGFLRGGRLLGFALGTAAGAALAVAVVLLAGRISPYYVVPLLIASLTLPIFAVSSAQDAIARAFDWIDVALIPGFIAQPLIVVAAMAAIHFSGAPVTARDVLVAACAAFWLVVLMQLALLGRRIGRTVGRGARRYEPRIWLKTSLPMFLVDGFFILLTGVDVLVLQAFVGPADVAVYHAATKTLVLIGFVSYAVSAASAHRFSAYHVAGEHAKLADFVAGTIRWTFWPSLALAIGLIIIGKPLLALFGPGFADGYPLMFVLVVGLLARAAVGPAERLLSMQGEQRASAAVYAGAFALNLVLCLILIPRFGLIGAASATASAMVCESVSLFLVAKRRLGLHAFILGR